MAIPILGTLIKKVFGVADKFIKDKDALEAFRHETTMSVLALEGDLVKAQAQIITAEAKGESWLQRNWRPLVMLFLTSLVGAHWLGFTAPNITEDIVSSMLDLVKIGLGGYVVGRSVEKTAKTVAPAVKEALSARRERKRGE